MRFCLREAWLLALAAAAIVCSPACGAFARAYEYEEELWLSMDGSATVDVNASLASLAALRGAGVNLDPLARADPAPVRAFFSAPGVDVDRPTFFRRGGRRFVHVRVRVPDIRRLSDVPPFAWSSYRFERSGEGFVFRQAVGKPVGQAAVRAEWSGDELVAFRVHVPSEILFENASSAVQRGNILTWEQPLHQRLAGEPIDMEIRMAPESILYTTVLLFGATIVAAAAVFAAAVLWLKRRGARELRERHPV